MFFASGAGLDSDEQKDTTRATVIRQCPEAGLNAAKTESKFMACKILINSYLACLERTKDYDIEIGSIFCAA